MSPLYGIPYLGLLLSNVLWLPYNSCRLHCAIAALRNALSVLVNHHTCASHLQVATGPRIMLRRSACTQDGE